MDSSSTLRSSPTVVNRHTTTRRYLDCVPQRVTLQPFLPVFHKPRKFAGQIGRDGPWPLRVPLAMFGRRHEVAFARSIVAGLVHERERRPRPIMCHCT